MKNPDQIIKEIIKRCEQEDAIVAVYLFGSAAMNRMKPSSDLDVALLLESESEATFPLLQLGTDLEKISGRRIDLLILNRSGELLQYQVRRFGKLIFLSKPVLTSRSILFQMNNSESRQVTAIPLPCLLKTASYRRTT